VRKHCQRLQATRSAPDSIDCKTAFVRFLVPVAHLCRWPAGGEDLVEADVVKLSAGREASMALIAHIALHSMQGT
jgi:hypothetical protein